MSNQRPTHSAGPCGRELLSKTTPERSNAHQVRHVARGLCNGCWSRAQREGTLPDYPPVVRRREELLEEIAHADLGPGLSRRHVARVMAPRLAMSEPSLRRALERARYVHPGSQELAA